jgi:hypothetical protein
VVDGVLPISDGPANDLALAEATTTVDHDALRRPGFVGVRESIEFDVPVTELLHTPATVAFGGLRDAPRFGRVARADDG